MCQLMTKVVIIKLYLTVLNYMYDVKIACKITNEPLR